MNTDAPPSPAVRFDEFRRMRRQRRWHLVAQAVLLASLFFGVNRLAQRWPWRADLTLAGRHSLAPETVQVLRNLPAAARIVTSIRAEDEDIEIARSAREVERLLEAFAFTTRGRPGGGIAIETLDPYRDRRRAEQLAVTEPNQVVVLAGDRRRTLFLDELYETEERTRTGFRGERVVAAALLEVTGDQRLKLYFIGGHGEMELGSVDPRRGLSRLQEMMRLRNLEPVPLVLAQVGDVPADAALVVLASPLAPLEPVEQEVLRRYLGQRAGRLIVLADPNQSLGLDDLLWDWGVLVDDALVVDANPAFLTETGDLVLRRLADHPITAPLARNGLTVVFGAARPVREDPGRPPDGGLSVRSLLQSSPGSWGERTYLTREPVRRDPTDLPGPLSLAVVAERAAASRAGINLPGGRLVVFGTSDFVSNRRLGAAGNLGLFLNAVQWAVGRDSRLDIPARPVERYQLALSGAQSDTLRFIVLLVLPGGLALLGLAVHLIRRT